MNASIQVTAAMLVPLLALTPSCTAPNREMRLQGEAGETLIVVAEGGGQPIKILEPEMWGSFRKAVREVLVKADPLAAAEETFGLAEGSGTYRYYVRSGLLVPETRGGLEEVETAAARMTREYLDWCSGTRVGYGDCLHLLAHSRALTLHGRYVVTLVMAMTASFGPMLDSLKDFADPNAVAVMLASAIAMYVVLLLVPEPISKLISLGITGALIGYLGLTMFWELVYGARAMARTVDAATDFNQLRGAARDFGKVLGPQMGQLLILLVSHSLGKGIAVKGAAGPPRFAEASAQAQRLLRVRLAAAGAVRSVTLGAGVITISLATGAMAVGAPAGTDVTTGPPDATHISDAVPQSGSKAAKVNPLEGTTYTGKVKAQMRPNPKTGRPDNHGFPLEVDNSAGLGRQTTIRGGDGVTRTKIELDGSYNGQQGTFEWIIERNGTVSHRLFVPKVGGAP